MGFVFMDLAIWEWDGYIGQEVCQKEGFISASVEAITFVEMIASCQSRQ